jgi:predicted DNA-binding transcriptional regulator AlpA
LAKKPTAKKAAASKRAARAASAAHARAVRASPSPTPELTPEAEAPSIERLLSKAEVCRIVGATFPTIWAWQRAGKFPRSRSVGGKSMWLESEVRQWMQALPVRRLKGDAEGAE